MKILFFAALLAAPALASDEADIRAARAAYGAAIDAHAPERFGAVLHRDFVQIGSGGSTIAGAATVAASYAANEFKDPAFITYERVPEAIEVSPNGTLAMERGHWQAKLRNPAGGVEGNAGAYQAGWVREDGRWQLRTEAYVKLTCAAITPC